MSWQRPIVDSERTRERGATAEATTRKHAATPTTPGDGDSPGSSHVQWRSGRPPDGPPDGQEPAVRPRLTELRWHARGGQGAITGSELLAEAALEDGLFFQAFPEFGAERTGAPIVAYTRLSTGPISLRSAIAEPGIVIVLDSTLLSIVDVSRGLKPGGLLLVNSPLQPEALQPKLPGPFRLATVPASRIALETLGRNIPNTVLVGALLRLVPVVRPETCLARMRLRLAQRLSARVVEQNVLAFQRGSAEVRDGV